MFQFYVFQGESDVLRTYSKAFGYKLASVLPDLPNGVWGLRNRIKPCNVSLANLMELCWHICLFHCGNFNLQCNHLQTIYNSILLNMVAFQFAVPTARQGFCNFAMVIENTQGSWFWTTTHLGRNAEGHWSLGRWRYGLCCELFERPPFFECASRDKRGPKHGQVSEGLHMHMLKHVENKVLKGLHTNCQTHHQTEQLVHLLLRGLIQSMCLPWWMEYGQNFTVRKIILLFFRVCCSQFVLLSIAILTLAGISMICGEHHQIVYVVGNLLCAYCFAGLGYNTENSKPTLQMGVVFWKTPASKPVETRRITKKKLVKP